MTRPWSGAGTSDLVFTLPTELEAHEPPEARGLARDGVRLLVSRRASGQTSHHRFTDLPKLLEPGDLLVVNTSATMPAAVDGAGGELVVHVSTELAGGRWLVELRRSTGKATEPYSAATTGERYPLPGNGSVTLREPYSAGRLWEAEIATGGLGSVRDYLDVFGRPIRYSYLARRWPLSYYQTVFGVHPGSAEMPSASRPFSDRLVSRLVAAGVRFAPVVLHTGVSSPEAHERPYPERFRVSRATAQAVNRARADGDRVIAVGTTVVRALESAADGSGTVRPQDGWTELVVTPDGGVRVVDGLLTGFHEPRASHLDMLAAIAGHPLLDRSYAEALRTGYLWHEFGDTNLIIP